MIVGFKTGPNTWDEGKRIVEEDGATMCEIWFRVDQADTYKEALTWFHKHQVKMGLHHWGLCEGNIKPNLATKEKTIREQTITQIQQAIDVAALYGCAYVNAHPGAQYLETLRFNPIYQTRIEDKVTPAIEAEKLFCEAVAELNQYATAKKMIFTVETMIGAEKVDDAHREPVYQPGTISPEIVAIATARGGSMANDFTHTAAWFSLLDADPVSLWQNVWDYTAKTARQTRLLHINRVTPPYNGTDSHTGITPDEWRIEGFPSFEQMKQLLQLFAARDDVYVIPEPLHDMQANYRALKQLVADQ